ncbi:MAG: hypothetical protein JWL79_920 [Frankiales bacterium]|nr:hypothetical protein [Frankiales bacterium]
MVDTEGFVPQVASARDIVAGDELTEVDTPDGPWYGVLRVDKPGGRVLVDDGSGMGVEVDVHDWAAAVLRRRPVEG